MMNLDLSRAAFLALIIPQSFLWTSVTRWIGCSQPISSVYVSILMKSSSNEFIWILVTTRGEFVPIGTSRIENRLLLISPFYKKLIYKLHGLLTKLKKVKNMPCLYSDWAILISVSCFRCLPFCRIHSRCRNSFWCNISIPRFYCDIFLPPRQ